MQKYRLFDVVVTREVEGDYFMLSNDGETILSLNGIGGKIVDSLRKKSSFDELLTKIVKTYDVSEKEATKDLLTFLQDLEEKKLIEVVNE